VVVFAALCLDASAAAGSTARPSPRYGWAVADTADLGPDHAHLLLSAHPNLNGRASYLAASYGPSEVGVFCVGLYLTVRELCCYLFFLTWFHCVYDTRLGSVRVRIV
jgi:hypothetical protein